MVPTPQPKGAASASPDRAIRVLLTTPDASMPGGVAQYLRVLRPHLPGDVLYFTIGSRSERERTGAAMLRVLQDSWRFARTLSQGNFDIVHLNPSIVPKALLRDGALLVLAKALRTRVLVFAHGWGDTCERALSRHLSPLFRLVYGRADAFIVLGKEFKERLRRLGYNRTVFVQAAPIEDDLLACSYERRVRRCADGSHQKFNILFLSRIEKEKGIYEALETYRILKQQHPYVSLTVTGDGSHLSRAVNHVQTLNLADVSFSGHVEGTAKYEIFQSADAYLFPSYSEGLPLSVLEAMASGLPIVTSAVGGLRDFFENGTMGFMTQSREPEVLASLLSRLICDPDLYAKISLFNHKYARDQFTSSQVAAQLERVYRFLHESAD